MWLETLGPLLELTFGSGVGWKALQTSGEIGLPRLNGSTSNGDVVRSLSADCGSAANRGKLATKKHKKVKKIHLCVLCLFVAIPSSFITLPQRSVSATTGMAASGVS